MSENIAKSFRELLFLLTRYIFIASVEGNTVRILPPRLLLENHGETHRW